MAVSRQTYQCPDIDAEYLLQECPFKLSLSEIGKIYDLDIVNDDRNKVFWNINMNNKVLIDDLMYDYLGYKGTSYSYKKHTLSKLLTNSTNNYIQYEEVPDEKDPRKKYYVLSGIDFESLLMQMRTAKVVELRRLFSKMKTVFVKYCEYERLYERHQSQLLMSQNNFLVRSVEDLKSLVVTVKSNADEERARAEEERVRAEEERVKSEMERFNAELDRSRAEERERKSEEEHARADAERRRAEDERQRAEMDRFVAEEREHRAKLERDRAEHERRRAEEERCKAEYERYRAVEERSRADQERLKADEERLKAYEERLKADEERIKSDHERVKAEEERYLAEQRAVKMARQIQRNHTILNTVIAPLVAPSPIGNNKIRVIGMYLAILHYIYLTLYVIYVGLYKTSVAGE